MLTQEIWLERNWNRPIMASGLYTGLRQHKGIAETAAKLRRYAKQHGLLRATIGEIVALRPIVRKDPSRRVSIAHHGAEPGWWVPFGAMTPSQMQERYTMSHQQYLQVRRRRLKFGELPLRQMFDVVKGSYKQWVARTPELEGLSSRHMRMISPEARELPYIWTKQREKETEIPEWDEGVWYPVQRLYLLTVEEVMEEQLADRSQVCRDRSTFMARWLGATPAERRVMLYIPDPGGMRPEDLLSLGRDIYTATTWPVSRLVELLDMAHGQTRRAILSA